MISLKLQNGMITYLDDEDAWAAANYHWLARKSQNGNWYACCNVILSSGKRSGLKLHRLLMDAQPGELIDHRNRSTLDNQKHNLRSVNGRNSRLNQRKRRDNMSGYRGVSKATVGNRWIMQISDKQGNRIKRYYQTPEEAAVMYDRAALRLHGAFAQLNFRGGFSESAVKPPAEAIRKVVLAGNK